jgi:hypothetical protein
VCIALAVSFPEAVFGYDSDPNNRVAAAQRAIARCRQFGGKTARLFASPAPMTEYPEPSADTAAIHAFAGATRIACASARAAESAAPSTNG